MRWLWRRHDPASAQRPRGVGVACSGRSVRGPGGRTAPMYRWLLRERGTRHLPRILAPADRAD